MELRTLFEEMCIEHQRTVPYTPEQNKCVERDHRDCLSCANNDSLQADGILILGGSC